MESQSKNINQNQKKSHQILYEALQKQLKKRASVSKIYSPIKKINPKNHHSKLIKNFQSKSYVTIGYPIPKNMQKSVMIQANPNELDNSYSSVTKKSLNRCKTLGKIYNKSMVKSTIFDNKYYKLNYSAIDTNKQNTENSFMVSKIINKNEIKPLLLTSPVKAIKKTPIKFNINNFIPYNDNSQDFSLKKLQIRNKSRGTPLAKRIDVLNTSLVKLKQIKIRNTFSVDIFN